MRKDIVVVDVDGTVAKLGKRLKHIEGPVKDYRNFFMDCYQDDPIWEIIGLVNVLSTFRTIVFVTGRQDYPTVRAKTLSWLQAYFNFPVTEAMLKTSPVDPDSHDTEVKPKLLNEWLVENNRQAEEIDFILEDRNSMVKKWRDLGFVTLQVAEGDF